MKVVTQSSCESEYVGLSEAANEAMHLSQLQGELGIGKEGVLLDNESSLNLATNLVFHQSSKHIRIKYPSLRDRVAEGLIELSKVDTGLNAADMFTKSVRGDEMDETHLAIKITLFTRGRKWNGNDGN